MNKKTIITALLALVTTAGKAQETATAAVNDSIDFVIEGMVSDGADSISLIERPYTKYKRFKVNGKNFRIVTRQPLHKFMQIEDGKGGYMQLIVDNQPAHITIDLRTNTVVEGSPLNKRFNHYQLIQDGIEKEMELHYEDADRTVYDSLEQRLNETTWQTIVENLDNIIPAYELGISGQFCMISPEQLAECMKEKYAFTRHPDMQHVREFYEAMQKRLPGQGFHDIELPDTTGAIHRLSEYVGKGQYVLLDFWASWCGPCIGSMPMMKRLHAAYADKGLQIIGISFDSKREAWLSAINRLSLPWLHLSDIKGWESIASDAYGIRAIPETVLIGPDGTIVATGLREKELEKKLAEIFKDGK